MSKPKIPRGYGGVRAATHKSGCRRPFIRAGRRSSNHGRAAVHWRSIWDDLSFQAYPRVSLQEAEALHEQQAAQTFVVLSNDRDQALETDLRPTLCSESDVFVFPPDMAWTMAFTHDDGWLGPFFVKHVQYSQLNQENKGKIKKAIEAEHEQGKRDGDESTA